VKRNNFIFFLTGAALLFVSCVISGKDTPPYSISRPVCVLGSDAPYYDFAGVTFTFRNTGDKQIIKLDVSFRIYDADTKKNPLIGDNRITASLNNTIDAGESSDLVVPLDGYIVVEPAKPYLIDFFYIAACYYSDGSVWRDKYGTYYVSSATDSD
jgi:hypothetical protein